METNVSRDATHRHAWNGSILLDVRAKELTYMFGRTLRLVWKGNTPEKNAKISAYLLYVASVYKRNLSQPIKPPDVWLEEHPIARTIMPRTPNTSRRIAYNGYVKINLLTGSMYVKNVPTEIGYFHYFFKAESDDVLAPIGERIDSLAAYY